jgi:hypothetical protein
LVAAGGIFLLENLSYMKRRLWKTNKDHSTVEEHLKREVGPPEKNKVNLEPPRREVGPQRKNKGKI